MSRRSATVLPFRLDRRPPAPARFKRRKRTGGGGGGQLMVMLPLAVFALVFFWDGSPTEALGAWDEESALPDAVFAAGDPDRESARFEMCAGGARVTCVVDGDTIWYRGAKIRIADIDTPEVSRPGCAREAELGAAATQRLRALLNEGPFSLEPPESGDGRDRERYGRLLRTVTRDGASLGAGVVDEGLAEEWQGRRRGWC